MRRLLPRVGYCRPFILLLPLLPMLAACDSVNKDVNSWLGPGEQMPGWSMPPVDVTISAPREPPAWKQEPIPQPPKGPAGYFVWDFGHWHWDGENFIWIPGYYVERPYRGSSWVQGWR